MPLTLPRTSPLFRFLKACKIKYLSILRSIPFAVLTVFPVYPKYLLLGNKSQVIHKGRRLFTVACLGKISEWRVKTFSSKEPETLDWIDGFSEQDVLFDIGANIGLYSLYAGTRGIKSYAFEPSAQNYALLNLNISINSLDDLISAYPLSCHSDFLLSVMNISSLDWASALSSFDNNLDQHGNVYSPVFRQGSIGISLDKVAELLNITPNHLKIDVDGNELLVLKGATKLLSSSSLRSILVELNPNRSDYAEMIQLIESSGLVLRSTQKFSDFVNSSTPYNCIFVR